MKPKRKFVVYQERKVVVGRHVATGATTKKTTGEWRWRCIAANQKIVASSGENFDSKTNALRAARREASMYKDGYAVVEVME